MKNIFTKILKSSQIITKNIEKYNVDWMNKFHGKAQTILLPSNTTDVSNILKTCNSNKIPIHIQGGNTGLVGGAVASNAEVLMSMEKLNKIKNFCDKRGVIHCQSGCILQVLDEHVNEKGWIMPLDLGAKGSCQIGGNIATNAGGIRFYKYGSLHQNVLGMKVVLPNGDIYNDTQGFHKNNTGYHIRNLMIGAEGTLGVVTECQLKLQKSKPSIKGMLFSLNNLEQLSKLIELSTNTLQDFIYAFELMDKKSLILHQKHSSNLPISIGNFNVLIETQFTDDDYHQSVLDKFFENCMENELIEDGTVTNNESQLNQLWAIREGITENLSKEPKNLYKFDISIKLNDIHTLQQKLKDYDTYFFGHVLDENIHLNILNEGSNDQIENIVYNLVNELNGSISAEHGIGIMKKKYLHQYDTKNQIQILKDIKKTFDPNNILNPGLIIN
jgi:FAD/FMN-containing dehydrogenase